MKQLLFLLISMPIIAFSQKNNGIAININDSVIYVNSDDIAFKKSHYHNINRFKKKVKLDVSIFNNSDSCYALYYFYKNIYPKMNDNNIDSCFINNNERLTDSTFIDDIMRKTMTIYKSCMGLRFAILDSNKNNLIFKNLCCNFNLSSGHRNPLKVHLANIHSRILRLFLFRNNKAPKYFKAIKIQREKNLKLTIQLRSKLYKEVYANWIQGCVLPKGIYYLYIYYWVDLRNSVPLTETVRSNYFVPRMNEKPNEYVRRDIKLHPECKAFNGYIKSNVIKMIVK